MLFGVRNRSWGKVMFSQVSVSHSIHGGRGRYLWSLIPSGGISGARYILYMGDGYVWRGGYVQGGRYSLPWTWDTTGYGRQAGGTHPAGMFSCY